MRYPSNVLLVDDEEYYHDLFKSEFEADDCCVHCARNELECIDAIVDGEIDFVVLDLRLENGSGRDVYIKAIQPYSRLAVAVWTSLTENSELVRWFLEQEVPVFYKGRNDTLDNLKTLIRRYRCKDMGDLRALIVDDEDFNRKQYRDCLYELGITEIEEASSVEVAEELIDQQFRDTPFDVFVLDLFFDTDHGPEPRGQTLAERLTTLNSGEKVVVFLVSTRCRPTFAEAVPSDAVHGIFIEDILNPIHFKEELAKARRAPFYVYPTVA